MAIERLHRFAGGEDGSVVALIRLRKMNIGKFLAFGAVAAVCILFVPASTLAESGKLAKAVDNMNDTEFEVLMSVIESGSVKSSDQSLGNALREFLECARAMTCLRCFGSFESDCVEFNLHNWLWCANPLNSVLLKCHSSAAAY